MKRAAAKPAHTPGPWLLGAKQDRDIYRHVFSRPGGESIVHVTLDAEVGEEEAEANARLIAEAPTLLELLIYLRDCAESGEWPTGERWAQVQAVIKKVTGGTP